MRLPPSLPAIFSALLLAGCSADSGSPAAAARTTFILFLLFLTGIFFVDHSSSFLNNPRFITFLQRHIRRLYTVSYLLGAVMALAALLAAFLTGQGRGE
ncbi:MAG: hypothetical protein LBC10_00305, partial [Deltaproteobacteria bacterium]|nr:hypothetical protein [Deltaproteobacteria bacterium]